MRTWQADEAPVQVWSATRVLVAAAGLVPVLLHRVTVTARLR